MVLPTRKELAEEFDLWMKQVSLKTWDPSSLPKLLSLHCVTGRTSDPSPDSRFLVLKRILADACARLGDEGWIASTLLGLDARERVSPQVARQKKVVDFLKVQREGMFADRSATSERHIKDTVSKTCFLVLARELLSEEDKILASRKADDVTPDATSLIPPAGYTSVRIVSWNEFDDLCQRLVSQLDRFHPDIVVGIARGGLPAAVRIAHLLNPRPRLFGMIAIWKYESEEIVESVGLPDPEESLGTAVIVDDFVIVGGTMNKAVEEVNQRYGEDMEVVTASLLVRDFSPPQDGPLCRHVMAGEIDSGVWVSWPWEQALTPREISLAALEDDSVTTA